jgi:hypothetical protein
MFSLRAMTAVLPRETSTALVEEKANHKIRLATAFPLSEIPEDCFRLRVVGQSA